MVMRGHATTVTLSVVNGSESTNPITRLTKWVNAGFNKRLLSETIKDVLSRKQGQ